MFPLALAVLASLTTLVGWALVAWRKNLPRHAIGWFLLAAGAAMCVISVVELLPTAVANGGSIASVTLWCLLGATVVLAAREVAVRAGIGADPLTRSAGLIAVAIGVHNIPEGAATVGAALLSVEAGIVTAVGVAVHNIPEGVAVAAPVVAAGGSRRRSFAMTLLATGGEVLGALIAVVVGQVLAPEQFAPMLAVVAGVMIALSLRELFPSGIELIRSRTARGDGDGAAREAGPGTAGNEPNQPGTPLDRR